ncbi:MAG: cation:proton antiporter [Anaerolineaceae bacterium]|nr:cation:proton antiporter [Anaerolineae bacterium]MCB9458268.1 cation:proton antiporter [Anaerolineaceae bacterium]
MEHNPAVALLLALGIIILASRVGGAIARWLKQPRVLGELIVGVLLGPTLLDFLHWDVFHGIELGETIHEMAELGVIILMFNIGLEVSLKELAKVGRVGIFAGVLGAVAPIVLVVPFMFASGYEWQPALFTGVTLAATSVSISAQVLFELGVLQTKEGNALLATALIDDVLAILLVSVVVAVTAASGASAGAEEGGAAADLGLVLLRMVGYIVIAGALAWFVVPRHFNWLAKHPSIAQSYGIEASALIIMLLFAWSAEELGGVATITGSFLAGIGMSRARESVKHAIEETASAIAYSFLVPIFFIQVGLGADLSTFPLEALPFAAVILVIAVISKVGGCGLGAIMGGFNRLQSLRLGVCMVSRGEVGLIVASIGLSVGIFTQDSSLFSALFLVILISTLITPILVRWAFAGETAATS